LLSHQNNYVKCLNIDDKAATSFNILATSLNAGLKKIIFFLNQENRIFFYLNWIFFYLNQIFLNLNWIYCLSLLFLVARK